MNINNKKIIVTGAANGIGKALVETLVEQGAFIAAVDIDENIHNIFNNEMIRTYTCDISDPGMVEITISTIINDLKGVDILINNAAYILNNPLINFFDNFKKHSVELWQKAINTDLNSVFYTTVNTVENMIKSRTKGLIINISSICANGNSGQSAYSASKAGVEAMTKAWAKELSPLGIRFACLAPGYTETETTMKSISDAVAKDIKNKTPLKRFAKIEEIVDGILFIIKNDYFNAKTLSIDGGLTL